MKTSIIDGGHSIFEVLQILRSLVSHNGISTFFFHPHNKENVEGALKETKKRMWNVFLNIEMLKKLQELRKIYSSYLRSTHNSEIAW